MNTLPLNVRDWLKDEVLVSCGHYLKGVLIDLMCLAYHGNPYGTLTDSNGSPLADELIAQKIGLNICDWRAAKQALLDKCRICQKNETLYIPRMLREGKPNLDPILDKIGRFIDTISQKTGINASKSHDDPLGNVNIPAALIEACKPAKSKAKRVAKPKKKFDMPEHFPDNLADAFALWANYRRWKHNPLTEVSERLQKDMLAQYSEKEACEIIKKSMQNDWIGLFEPKGKKYGQSKQQENSEHRGQYAETNGMPIAQA